MFTEYKNNAVCRVTCKVLTHDSLNKPVMLLAGTLSNIRNCFTSNSAL